VQRNHWRIRTPIELATIILESCTANGAESSARKSGLAIPEYEIDYGTFDFLDWFYLSIRAVVWASIFGNARCLLPIDGVSNGSFRTIHHLFGEDGGSR